MIVKFYKHEYKKTDLFGDISPLLSMQADVSIVMSIKNVGKSYPAMKLCKKATESGKNCVWLRWCDSEMTIARDEFLRDETFKADKMVGSKHGMVLRNVNTGFKIYILGVKYAVNYKGIDIPNLAWIVYDEYIPEYYDVQTRRTTEFDKFMIILTALWRKNNPRVLLIGNTIDWYNPYLTAWKIVPFEAGKIRVSLYDIHVESDDTEINKTFKIAVENMKPSPKMIERVLASEGLRGDNSLMQKYIENYYKNQYSLTGSCDNKIKLEPIQLLINGNYYSYRLKDEIMYWTKSTKRNVLTYVCNRSDIGPNSIVVKSFGQHLEQAINLGLSKFADGSVYNAIIDYCAEVKKL